MNRSSIRPSRIELQEALRDAISLTFSNDRLLFGQGAKSERAIVFRVGLYLAHIVERWAGDWVVDAEYGRWYPEDDAVAQKALDGKPATPDLIVHKNAARGRICSLSRRRLILSMVRKGYGTTQS